MTILFCNIGWMAQYRGQKGRPDRLLNGGTWVDENETGGEVCNFLPCEDGRVYGHVETIRGDIDQTINIERLGADVDAESIDRVNVVWTATPPDEGGRRVVGWYRNATVFKERRKFDRYPSLQHRRDGIDNFRIWAMSADAHLLLPDDRSLVMDRGTGWMGQSTRWYPDRNIPEISDFVAKVERAIQASRAKRVFLSYRRTDSQFAAKLLYDSLVDQISAVNVFKDVDSIGPATDYRLKIEASIADSAAMLVLIGPHWLSSQNADGTARLSEPADPVRVELEAAKRSNLTIIPVLCGDVSLPSQTDLPDTLKWLRFSNAYKLRPDGSLNNDMAAIVRAVCTL